MMRIKKAEWIGYFGFINSDLCRKWKELPEALPWYEPSINMLYLEACSSWLFGNGVGACTLLGTLLEHSLKMAIIDIQGNGAKRQITNSLLDRYYTFGNILALRDDELQLKLKYLLESQTNIDWWIQTAKPFRDAFAHLDIKKIIKKFSSEEFQGDYAIADCLGSDPGQWGHLWHRFADNLARKMIKESNLQLKTLLGNTLWEEDLSWWELQKKLYDSFFLGEGLPPESD
jgi:hypothetical protein